MTRGALAITATLVASALPGPVQAQDGGHAADRALAPLVECRPLPDPVARATCYDRALDRLQQAVAGRQVVIVDHEQAVQDRRTLFGFDAGHRSQAPAPKPPKLTPAARSAPAEDLAEIDSTVVSAQPYGYDQWTIRIATGAVWRTTESGVPVAPRAGTRIHIHRGVMGSYMLRVGPGRAIRAIRVG